ncbi:hypothetical protein B0H66DRAFT_330232 [Apodospora peruviana]|uniref:Uncharacterized protein n=1 Tax=Apodospora peruviana TaxID=516989 RepID=A0AAE0HXY9_9PEZI|nr:hypothetical protein B0H66DRAFT_330232 [Apodospora peruviana]
MSASAPITTKLDLIHGYRHLLRAGLRAVCFSIPGRFIIRNQLRTGFRDPKGTFDGLKVKRTVLFLQAAQFRGQENRILKNLMRVHHERKRSRGMDWHARWVTARIDAKKKAPVRASSVAGKEYEHYERTLAMLNDTMNLCLRI